jgi:hypothetical protein
MTFPVKHPAEQIYAGVDWAAELGAETIVTKVVTAYAKRSKARDPNPSAIISGASTHSGTIQSQLIVGGIAGVDYETEWKITTSAGRTLVERVTLLVR